ncbi:MAG: release factor glutamine methyltransferase, partial [Acidimicrobiaceae bacterium]|nr:release factor glutamine methyltransferase [Acidimicrobiaceae bacterium]
GEVLDLCTGRGAVALSLAAQGARVAAVDIDELAVAAARANAERRGLQAEVLLGDLFEPVSGRTFDLITCNPPYLPAPPGVGCARWDAGPDGRSVVDRICREIDDQLAPGGALLLVQSHLTGIEPTLDLLRRQAFEARVVAEHVGPLGPIASARIRYLEHLLDGTASERLVVIEATRRP